MIRIKTSVVGLERFEKRATNRLNFLGGDGVRAVLEERGKALVKAYKDKIESFTPGEVQDLAESTKKQKAKTGAVYPILVRTRTMINSMYSVVRSPLRGSGWAIAIGFSGSQNGVSNARIAEIHITGEGHMPKRDFTKVPREWVRVTFNALRDALTSI